MRTVMRKIYILGSGYSTHLSQYLNEEIDGHPLWISRFIKTNPEALEKMFLDYLNAGTEIINTLTYQGSISGFMKSFGLSEEKSYDLFKEAVRIARRAVDEYLKANPNAKKPLISGGAGSYGACLNDGSEYTGSFVDKVNMNDVMDWHRPRVKAMVEEGVDLIAFETIPALAEAKACIKLMKEFPQQKFYISFQCKDSKYTAYGDDFKKAVKECWELSPNQLVAVGCNCLNPKFVFELFSGINEPGKITYPLIVYPNSGEEFTVEKGWHGGEKWDNFDKMVTEWLDQGVTYLGSCCRTDINYVRKNKAVLEKYIQSKTDFSV